MHVTKQLLPVGFIRQERFKRGNWQVVGNEHWNTGEHDGFKERRVAFSKGQPDTSTDFDNVTRNTVGIIGLVQDIKGEKAILARTVNIQQFLIRIFPLKISLLIK